ncbi:MAG: DUF4340 domain-containing protein [Bacteroidales bacterium]|nr:DUF4340 domain-containing protein [Bacteroidales bacterium]
MKKKTKIILVCSLVAAIALVAFIMYKANVFNSKEEFSQTMFASADSSLVKKVFIADMNGHTVLLQRHGGEWRLGDSTMATPELVRSMLSTLMNLRVDRPVPSKQIPNLTRVMAASAIKVEVYEDAPKFTLFGHDFGVKERHVRTIYFGPETPDHMGNYAILEGMEEKPCVVALPGFRGIITPRFSPYAQDWMSHQLFSTKPTRIQELRIIDHLEPANSFSVRKVDDRHYNLLNAQGEIFPRYDTAKVFNLLAEFRDKKFETIATSLDQEKIDHILADNLFKTVTFTDINGTTTTMRCYFMDEDYDYYDDQGDKLTDIEHLFNQDRFYAVIGDDTKTIYVLQYFGFGRMVQTTLAQLVGEENR